MCSDDLVSPAPSPSCRFAPLLYMFLSLSLFPPSLRFQPQDERGFSTLWIAAEKGHVEVVKLLLTEGNAEVDKAANDGVTPLYAAAMQGKTEVVKLLLTEGNAEVDKTNNTGATPLYVAAEQGMTEVVKLLLRGGADANIAIQGWTPLMIAKHYGHQAVVALLQ